MIALLAKRTNTISGRLALAGGLAILAMLLLAIATIFFATSTRRAAEALYQQGLLGASEAAELDVLLEAQRRLIEPDASALDPAARSTHRWRALEMSQRMADLARRAAAALPAETKEALLRLAALERDVLGTPEASAPADVQGARQAYVVETERLQDVLRRHRSRRIADANSELHALADRARRQVIGVGIAALLAVLLIGPMAVLVLHRLATRLKRITVAMRMLAANDTTVPLAEVQGPDEIGAMAEAVAVFRDNAVKLLDQQRELSELNRRLDIALNNMARGLSMFDAEQRLVVCNAAYGRMYDLPLTMTRPGTPYARILAHRAERIDLIEGVGCEASPEPSAALASFVKHIPQGRLRQRMRDGRIIDISAKPLDWGGWVALHEDVSERVAAAEKITRLAEQDALTGLANRHSFQAHLDKAALGLAGGQGFALIAIDLDHFKEVNDSLGHPTGDALLEMVGARLRATARQRDVIARLGGDEFAILMPECNSIDGAISLAERIIELLHRPFEILGQRVEIGGSCGIAMAPENGTTPEDILRNADMALYGAKGTKRGTWSVYEPAMAAGRKAVRELETDLAVALRNGELSLNYQPIVSLALGQVVGCEALIRWRHPEKGFISPAEFIPVAEASGLINEIGAWALGEACKTAAQWPRGLKVAVNLSVAQFTGPDLVGIAEQALAASGLEAGRLELEVTESLLLADDPETHTLLVRLKSLGLSIALDDFGTGYSSLSHLRSFPFDKIKIDQTFVRDLPQRRNCEAIVGAVAQLAKSLGMTTVAEGVETTSHLERARKAGCDAVQGYYYSKPVPKEAVIAAIEAIDQRLACERTAA